MSRARFDTDRGTFTAELYGEDAPGTVENFEKLANDGFYDGIAFHRVIDGFVVQGGDPITREHGVDHPRAGTGGPGYTIDCELEGNPRRHETGALSMAHAGRDTGGSQFFIVLEERNASHLNGQHTVFGKVVDGMDVVEKIERGDRMERVTIEADAE